MSEAFDPYHCWLGIPPENQPPDHYRLLGIEQFESDEPVIGAAADRQMQHVRSFQLGPRAALSQQLLNEIAAARVCLLNVEKKARYDQSLRAASASDLVAATDHDVPVLELASATSQAPPAVEGKSSRSRLSVVRTPAVIAGAGVAIIAVVIAAVLMGRGDPTPSVADQGDSTQQQAPASPQPSSAKNDDQIGGDSDGGDIFKKTPVVAAHQDEVDPALGDSLAGGPPPSGPQPVESPAAVTLPDTREHNTAADSDPATAENPAKKPEQKKPLTLPDLIEKVEPSVVLIRVTGAEGRSLGSGFVVDKRGYIATNYHVIDGAVRAEVVFRDKSRFEVKGFLAATKEKDLAILKIECPADKLIPIALAGKLPRKGEQVLALGAPKGFDFTTSDGIVSAIRTGRDIRDSFLANFGVDVYAGKRYSLDMTWVQTSAPISPGNSGGPLVNMKGEVVGVNTWKYRDGQNLNFAGSALEVTALLKTVKGTPRPLDRLGEAPAEEINGRRFAGEIGRFSKHTGAIRAIAVSRDGRYIATAGEDKFCYVLDGKTLGLVRRYGPHTAPLTGVDFMADGTVVFSTLRDQQKGASIYVWDWRAKRIRTQLADSNQNSYGLTVSPDGKKLAVSMGSSVARVYYPSVGGRFGLETPFKDRLCNAVAFSPDSQILVMGSGGGIVRWVIDGPQRRHAGDLRAANAGVINSLVFSPDGNYLLSGHGDRALRMWKFREGSIAGNFVGHQGAVTSGRFSPDGKKVVSGSLDKTVRVWETSTQKVLRQFKGHSKGVTAVAFLPDGERLVSAGLGGTLRMWSLKKLLRGRPPVATGSPRDLPDGPGKPKLANDSIPDSAALATANELLRDLYKDDYAKAVTASQKRALAIKILRQGADAKNSPAERYVSFRAARRIATQIGSVALALESVDLFEAWFDIDTETMRRETIERLAAQVHSTSDRVSLARAALAAADRLIAMDQYDRATRLIGIADSAASRAKHRTLLKTVRDRAKQIEQGRELRLEYLRAVQTLKGKPDDPEANLRAGKYLCFTKGQWKSGLGHLSKGSDAGLKAVALLDLAEPTTPEARAAAGASWQKLALGVDESRRTPYLAAAQFWYLQAIGELTGLRKLRVKRELANIGEIPAAQRRK
ncbi:MAG: trypsin-like peptidase domain-containing protein [Planctomycetes bacterium]|nr:trypsin-like peptidase domain-containing protein [Planctomycetota bacterium]